MRSGLGDIGFGGILAVNRLVLLVAVPLFPVLAVFAFLAIRFATNERDAQGWVRHAHQVMEAERRLQDGAGNPSQQARAGRLQRLLEARARGLETASGAMPLPQSARRRRWQG